MTALTRRAALTGALASSVALSLPIGASLAGKDASAGVTLAKTDTESPTRSYATIPAHAEAISDLLAASADTWMVSITAERFIVDMHPGLAKSSVRGVELMRALASALHEYGEGADQFRAIVEPDGQMWLQGTDRTRPQRGNERRVA